MPFKDGASASHIRRYWQVLCAQIGERHSGTDAEQCAADYIEGRFKRLGLQNVHQHRFEFPNCAYSRCVVRAGRGKRLTRIKTARPFNFTKSTATSGVRGQLAYLQTGTALDFNQPTRGRIGLLIGSLSLADPDLKKRLVQSGLIAMLVVDARIPFDWITTAGCAPQWVGGYNIPTASIAYFDARDLVKRMPQTVQVTIKASTFAAMSQNVIGEVVGTRRPDQVIVVNGHHDTVFGTVGANDNASGVIFTLELARIFAKRRPTRTIRFISYGVEEKLSVGSYLYAQSLSPLQRRRCVLAINADAISSHIGVDAVNITGSASLHKLTTDAWRRCQHPVDVQHVVSPYSDHFPMNLIGVPSLALRRTSLPNSHWMLHSTHDSVENSSGTVLSRTINTSARFLHQVSNAPRLPFKRGIDAPTMREVRAVAKVQLRHPWSAEKFVYN